MNLLSGFNLKKDKSQAIVGIALLIYLYLGTPIPSSLMLNNYFLFLALLLIIMAVCKLVTEGNLFIALLFALVAFDVVRKSMKPNLKNIDKQIRYYDNVIPSKAVVSDKLKTKTSLEQEMVQKMKQTNTSNNFTRTSPRYQPIVPNIAGLSQVE